MPAVQQKLDGARMWEFRLAAESAIGRVEDASHLRDSVFDDLGSERTGGGFVQILRQHFADCLGLGLDLVGSLMKRVKHAAEDRAEPRPSIPAIRREVRSPEEDLALWRQERSQRPTALLRESLHRSLVAGIYVRSLVPV